MVEGTKVKRSMFAETQREKAEILNGIRESEWNAEMNPMVLSLQETGTLLHNFTQGLVQIESITEAVANILSQTLLHIGVPYTSQLFSNPYMPIFVETPNRQYIPIVSCVINTI